VQKEEQSWPDTHQGRPVECVQILAQNITALIAVDFVQTLNIDDFCSVFVCELARQIVSIDHFILFFAMVCI